MSTVHAGANIRACNSLRCTPCGRLVVKNPKSSTVGGEVTKDPAGSAIFAEIYIDKVSSFQVQKSWPKSPQTNSSLAAFTFGPVGRQLPKRHDRDTFGKPA